MKFVWSAVLLFSQMAHGYDCSKHVPFEPIEFQKASIEVGRFYYQTASNGQKVEVNEQVCATTTSLSIPVLDIRGREEEWFYCHDEPQPEFACETTFQGEPTEIRVKPAIVIRSWKNSARRDTHFHAYVLPNHDPLKYIDIFARAVSPELQRRALFLDAAGGGRGEESGIDSFYIGADFAE